MSKLRFPSSVSDESELYGRKAELEKIIHEFSVRHNQELGELIIKILGYLKEKAKGTSQEAEAKKDYEDFSSNYEATKNETVSTLTEEEQKNLKDNYRKASKLCHPDVVDEDQKETAHKIFSELNAAYQRNDAKRVAEILNELQHGKTFTSKADTTNEKQTLLSELKRLRIRLQQLIDAITAIKTSDIFEKIIRISDWDEYFSKTKQQLQDQLTQLENERK